MTRILIAVYVIATSSALIALKWGTKAGALAQYIDHKIHFNFNPYALLGVSLYGISFVLYTYLISKYDLGYIIPLTTALVYAIIFGASYIIFNEQFTVLKVTGIALVTLGIVFLNLKG